MMKTYRVFVTRHYIDVCFFDVESDSLLNVKTAARKAAYKLRADSRTEATDNGWIPDQPVSIERLGNSAAPFPVELFFEDKNGTKCYREVQS